MSTTDAGDILPDAVSADLSAVVIPLLKGVLYEEASATHWQSLLRLQARVRDYIAVLGLELVLDEAEGYAFLRARPDSGDRDDKLPRLIVRRPLSFSVSLLLALLRRKLAEFDASGGSTRLVLGREEIVELLRVFLPDTSNEARLVDQIDSHINKAIELGFLRRLQSASDKRVDGAPTFEVRRIVKAYVDAQWLSEFDQRLAAYQSHLGEPTADDNINDADADGDANGDAND